MAEQTQTPEAGKATARKALVVSRFAKPPEQAHEPKGCSPAVVSRVQKAKDDGVWLVENPAHKGHVQIVVKRGTEIATHGGCVRPERAAYYGQLHAQIYGLPVKADWATDEVRTELAPAK